MLTGLRVEVAAHAMGVSVRATYKWPRRFRKGESVLKCRLSRPHSCLYETSGDPVNEPGTYPRGCITTIGTGRIPASTTPPIGRAPLPLKKILGLHKIFHANFKIRS